MPGVDPSLYRSILKEERRLRQSGQWGPWETIRFPKWTIGGRWAAQFDRAHRNKVFAVLDRAVDGPFNRHLAVASLSGIRPTWREMQRIKNDLAGEHATAVEIYPPQDEVIDAANMFHIWISAGAMPSTVSLWHD